MIFITRMFKNKAVLMLLVLVVAAVFMPELAHAETPTAADTSEKVAQSLAKLLSIAMQFLNAMLWPILIVIGDLMKTDLILGPGMESTLKGIWIPVRDLVNIGFVLVLLVVAFYNVLGIGGGEGDLALKTALPKIVLGLVVVNFTFVAGKVVIDLTNVATTAVFALPEMAAGDETPYDFSAVKTEFQINVCYKTYVEADGTHTSWGPDDETANKIPIYTKLFCTKSTTDGTYDELDGVLAAKYFTDLNANNIGLVMAVNMGGLSNLSLLKDEGIDNFTDLTVSFVFAVVMYSIFAITYIVLGIVLITRLIVLWIALALSPLAVLTYVVPQIKEWTGGGGDFAQKIIKHLMAPIIIGATMSLGYILIAAWDGLAGNSGLASGGFKVDDVISTEFLINGMKDLPHFIIALASIVIVWKGVFAAASDTYASFATDAIKGFGESVRDFAFKLPMSIPTVPLGVDAEGKESKISIGALKMFGDNAMQGVTNGSWNAAELDELGKKGVTMFGIPLGSGPMGNNNPQANASSFMAEARATGDVDYSRATTLAKNLMHMVNSGNLDAATKRTVSERLQELHGLFSEGKGTDAHFKELTDILNNPAHNHEQLGFGTAALLAEARTRMTGKKLDKTNAPNAKPATGTPTPHPAAPAITAVVNLITPTATLSTQADALAAGAPAPLKVAGGPIPTLTTNVGNARTAVGTLQTTPTAPNLTAAKGAVTTALTQARTLRTEPTIAADATLLGNLNSTITQLEAMETQLNAITI